MKEKYQFGADFEFHLYDKRKETFIPAEVYFGINKHASISSDHLTAEIRPAPSNNIDELIFNTRELLIKVKKEAKNVELVLSPTVMYDVFSLKDLYLKYPDILDDKGFEYDIKNYKNRLKNMIIIEKGKGLQRSAGGHLWLNCEESHSDVVKLFDAFLAIPFILMFPCIEEALRRTKYGKAGEYRQNGKLLEYRTLSTIILYSPTVLKNTLLVAKYIIGEFRTVQGIFSDTFPSKKSIYDLKRTINTCDYCQAQVIWEKLLNYAVWKSCDEFKHLLLEYDRFIKYMNLQYSNTYNYSKRNELLFHNWII